MEDKIQLNLLDMDAKYFMDHIFKILERFILFYINLKYQKKLKMVQIYINQFYKKIIIHLGKNLYLVIN